MRRFAAGLVLFILPISGVRVICVEVPVDAAASPDAAPTPAADDCERLCALRHVAHTDSNAGRGSHCALSTNPSCFDIFGNIAVFHAPDAFEVSLVATPLVDHAPALYLEPSLTHLGPPPRF
jgi:hypothetical protein